MSIKSYLVKYEENDKFEPLNTTTTKMKLTIRKELFGGLIKWKKEIIKAIPNNNYFVYIDHWKKLIKNKKPLK